jgi:hypothetical protein
LKAGDCQWAAPGKAEPTDAFVKAVCQKLVGEGNDIPRFVLIPNMDVLGQEKVLRGFQSVLLQKIAGYMASHHPEAVAPNQPLPDANAPKQGVKTFPMPNSLSTQSTLHFDQLSSPFISLLYGPNKNVTASAPRVADLRQFCRDQKLPDTQIESMLNAPPQMFRSHQSPLDKSMPDSDVRERLNARPNTISPKKQAEVEARYTLTLDDMDDIHHRPLLIINNRLSNGVLHGGPENIRPVDPKKPSIRPVWYAAFRSYFQ